MQSATLLSDTAASRQHEIAIMELKQKQKQEDRQDRVQAVGQGVALGVVVLVALGCLWIIVSNKYPATTVEKAAGALLLIVGGFIGFVTGQATKK